MILRDFLTEHYAITHNLKARTVVLFASSIDRFRDCLGREPEFGDLNDLTVSKFLRWRAVTPHRGKIVRPASVAKDKAHIVSLWNAAAKKRLVDHFPDLARNIVKVPHVVPHAYTVGEVSAMIRAAQNRLGFIGPCPAPWFWCSLIMAAWFTGERVGSLLAIRWAEADTHGHTLTFLSEHRKGMGRTITRSISPGLSTWLEAGRRQPTDLVWPWTDHRKINTIYQRLQKICWNAGVEPHGFHSIRKAAGSYVKLGGGDSTEFLTHASDKTTRDHYLSPRVIKEKSVIDLLPPLDLG